MNYDFAQVRRFEDEEVMIMFKIIGSYKDGNKNKYSLTGYDEQGNTYTAVGITGYNYKIDAYQIERAVTVGAGGIEYIYEVLATEGGIPILTESGLYIFIE